MSSSRPAARIWVFALGVLLLASPVAHAQERAQLMVQLGHSRDVRFVAFSPNGLSVLTIGYDQVVLLWDGRTGRQIREFEGYSGGKNLAAFSPDGRYVLMGNALWEVADGHELRTFVADKVILVGPQLVPGEDREVDHAEANPTRQAPPVLVSPDGPLLASAFSANGGYVLTDNVDAMDNLQNTVRLWSASSGREIRHVKIKTGRVTCAAFSSDGRYLLAGGSSGATLWDVIGGREIRWFNEQSGFPVDLVAFSPDSHYVLTANQKAQLWDARTGLELRTFDVDNRIDSVAFSPRGRYLLTGAYYKVAQLWDTISGKQLRQFGVDDPEAHNKIPPPTGVNPVAFSPDGRYVLTGSGDRAARLWDATSGKELRRFEGHGVGLTSAAFSDNGQYLLTVSRDRVARLWDAISGRQLQQIDAGPDGVLSAAFSHDGQFIVMGGFKTALLWDVQSSKVTLRFDPGSGDDPSLVAISRDGRLVLTSGMFETATVWDAKTGQRLRQVDGSPDYVKSAAFSPDGKYVLTRIWGPSVKLWDAASGKGLGSIPGPHYESISIRDLSSLLPGDDASRGSPVAFSPNGRFVLIGTDGDVARLSDLATALKQLQLKGHTAAITSVAFSPNGRYALTGSLDDTARLWDAASGQELRRFEGNFLHGVESVAFSPDADGQFVLTGSDDGTTRLWNSKTGKELASIISFDNGGWAVVDPEGRFDTSDLDGEVPLHWVLNDDPMRALPLEIFMHDYYTPRLLSRIMNHEKLPYIRPIAQITNRVQPDVSIISVTGTEKHPGRADVVVHAASHINNKGQQSGLRDLRLFRNGQLVGFRKGKLADGNFTFNDIQLPTTINSAAFTAYAFNRMNIKSATAEIDFAYYVAAAAKPRAYLLQIGVNHYQASGCELHGSVTDAEELSRVLTDRLTKRGLDVEAVRLVSTGKENGATKENIREALNAIASAATPDDVFFLSFSGHGYGDKNGQFYIFPSDVQGRCNGVDDAMLSQAISADELTEWLRPIDAGEMTFVLDACHSASSVEANDFKPGPMGSRGLGQLAYDKRMRILAASQSDQEAVELHVPSANGSDVLRTQGLLSYELTEEGLVEKKADWKPEYGKITVGKWLSYAADAVPKSLEAGTVQTPKGAKRIGTPTPHAKSAQIPAVFDFSKKDTFVLQ